MVSKATIESWQRAAPFASHLGIRIVSADAGRSELELPGNDFLSNRKGDVHGGAIASLADMAVGTATRSDLDGLFSISSVNLTVNYLRPARGSLFASGTVVRRGRRLAFAEAAIRDGEGKVVATASATIVIIRAKAESTA